MKKFLSLIEKSGDKSTSKKILDYDFMDKYYNKYTYNGMGPWGSSYEVPRENGYEGFWKAFIENPSNDFYERVALKNIPLLIDLDLLYDTKNNTVTEQQLLEFIGLISYIFKTPNNVCIVQRRKEWTTKKGKWSLGYHITFPDICLNSDDAKKIRKYVLARCEHLFTSSVCKVDDIYDEAIYGSNRLWKMDGHDYYIWRIYQGGKLMTLEEKQKWLEEDLASTFDGIFKSYKIKGNEDKLMRLACVLDRARYISPHF